MNSSSFLVLIPYPQKLRTIAFVLFMFCCLLSNGLAQPKTLPVSQQIANNKTAINATNSDTNLIITGKVLNHHNHLPVKKIEMEIVGASFTGSTFICVTDAYGGFKFQLPDSLTAKDVILRPTYSAERLLENEFSEILPIKFAIDDFPFRKNVTLYKCDKYDHIDQPKQPVTSKLVTHLSQKPMYPGSNSEMLKFLQKNIQYPQMERDNNIQGIVYVRFMIDEYGAVIDVQVAKRTSPGLDKEAVRVIKSMPKWHPAIYDHKPVRVYYSLPVEFKLE